MSRRPALQLETFLPWQLSVAANAVSEKIAAAYSDSGLNVPQWRVLAALGEVDSASQQAIAARIKMDKMTVSRTVAGLLKKKLLTRDAHTDDARQWQVRLSEKGTALLTRVVPQVLEAERTVLKGLSKTEREMLGELLAKLG